MISTDDFKRGLRVELDGDPFVILDYSTQSPSGRSSNTLVRAKLRNIRTGQLFDRVFKAGERLKVPDFEVRDVQYLYDEGGEFYYFMDNESYEQFGLPKEQVENELKFLRPNDEARALVFNGHCIGIELPPSVTLKVVQTEPGYRGDTVNNAMKAAVLETGAHITVPLFVEEGEHIVVDTREMRYVRRA